MSEEFNLRDYWDKAAKREKDWRDAGESKLLAQMHDAYLLS